MKQPLYVERLIATLSICTIMVVALSLALVANCEYQGLPYYWPWEKIALASVLLIGAALGLTVFAIRATNIIAPEVCRCESPSSIDGICNECSFKLPEGN